MHIKLQTIIIRIHLDFRWQNPPPGKKTTELFAASSYYLFLQNILIYRHHLTPTRNGAPTP